MFMLWDIDYVFVDDFLLGLNHFLFKDIFIILYRFNVKILNYFYLLLI